MLDEGTYDGRLEVIADDRYFVPLKVTVDMQPGLTVEAAVVSKRREEPEAEVSATLVAKTNPNPVIVEKKDEKAPTRRPRKTIPEGVLRSMIRDILKVDGPKD